MLPNSPAAPESYFEHIFQDPAPRLDGALCRQFQQWKAQASPRSRFFLGATPLSHIPTSRRAFQKWIQEGRVMSSPSQGSWLPLQEPDKKVPAGQKVRIYFPKLQGASTPPTGESIPLDILYEDEDILVVNKPSPMVVHPGPGHRQGTLVHALLHRRHSLSSTNGQEKPGIIHRLDRGTSGLLLVAKQDHAHEKLAEQFQKRSIEKTYWALCHGSVPPYEQTLATDLGRHPKDRQKMAVLPPGKGRHSITHYQGIGYSEQYPISLVACGLETGRTHQIRVHMAHLGFPLIRDEKYGMGPSFFHQIPWETPWPEHSLSLHAYSLRFRHPITHQELFFQGSLPLPFRQALLTLGIETKET